MRLGTKKWCLFIMQQSWNSVRKCEVFSECTNLPLREFSHETMKGNQESECYLILNAIFRR